MVTQEDPPAANAEIEKRAGDPRFAQIMLPPKSLEPQGRRRYWPIYEAAAAAGFPIGVHAFGQSGEPNTSSGWASYYIEEMVGHAQTSQSVVTSFVTEGVFARFPRLKLIMVEGGCAWAPSLAWRLDKVWRTLKAETPSLTRAPSEYIRDHFWFTTQPLDEPPDDSDLLETFELVGLDRIMFSTDYPHWDFDEPRFVTSKLKLNEDELAQILRGNACALSGFDA